MKSLALHLLTILLLGSLQINIDKDSTLLRFGASAQSQSQPAVAATTTKPVNRRAIPTRAATLQTPSLSASVRRELHSSTTTETTTLSINNRYINRRRQRVESSTLTSPTTSTTKTTDTTNKAQTKSRRRIVSHARDNNNNNSNKNNNRQQSTEKTMSTTKKLISTRLVRDATDKIDAEVARSANHANTVRQNRSLQSETTLNHNHNDLASTKQRRLSPNRRAEEVEKPLISTRNSTKTFKSPRMIERLVAGHIQNAESRSKYEVSAVTINSTVTNSSTTVRPTEVFFRRKQPMLSSSYRQTRPTMATTTEHDPYDDEALLDEPEDFDNWDNGILRLSAGSGKESSKTKKHKEDSKKTLSDQVRDGKYGLIEHEIFGREPKRPGVLSYAANKEVPIDNERNFGGLNEEDIWLAEDHLLVIKGGSLNEGEAGEPWSSIDDFEAPKRQIKIPANPKIPPPFPVQLEENGPIQFIGNNKFTVVYPVSNETSVAHANNSSSQSAGDNEKNVIARPTASKDTKPNEPGYIYPAPYPPWLYHNQTFVNPFLTNARPITFPGLGPFPLGRNSTFVKLNGSEPFDEDDPSLYYPPAYSFVYKNNYTNPVAPGPLVPGIVLPPPPDHFSRLEAVEKSTTTTTELPLRHRIYTTTPTSTSTTSTSTSTTTTTTTTTTSTESPFKHVITKISQYTPKTIIITATSPTPTSPPTKPAKIIEAIPIYPIKSVAPARQNVLTFVPTTDSPKGDTLSKSNPIYYEYFEAKRQPGASNVIDDFLSSTSTTKLPPAAVTKPIKLYAASKRPYKNSHSIRGSYVKATNQRPYVPESVVYITPKPALPPLFKQRPLENFEREVQALRETLRFYQNQQLRDNNIPRIPKAKTIYEYSFDATKSGQTASQNIEETPSSFRPPAEFDEEPFKPMVTYSPPLNDENSFRAIPYEKPEKVSQKSKAQKYQSSTTLVPVQGRENVEYVLPQSRSKQLRLTPKYLPEPYVQGREADFGNEYQTTQRTILTTQSPWLAEPLEKMPQPMQRQPQVIQIPAPTLPVKNPRFTGYYYRPTGSAPARQNNRFYDEPFHNSVRKVVSYRPQSVWSLENDTYVNYLPNRPATNPDAEYIDPYVISGYATAQHQGLTPPPLSHQSQFYAPPQRVSSAHRQNAQVIPLHRDILVNYRQPLPPINPDAEYIAQPRPYYRPTAGFRLAPPPVEQSNYFYITPKYRRSNGMSMEEKFNENESNLPSNGK